MADDTITLVQCPYCLNKFHKDELTIDHVIARSFFPVSSTSEAKWKVRACGPCNNRKSKLERDVLGRLALCLDPNDPALADIVTKAQRSMDPRSATTAREFMHRFNRRAAMRRSVRDIWSPDEPGVLPYFTSNFAEGSRTGILVPAELDVLIEYWVRGIHFCEYGQIIPADYQVSVLHIDDETRKNAFAHVIERAKVLRKGQGIEVKLFHAKDTERFATIYGFDVWWKLRCVAVVEQV